MNRFLLSLSLLAVALLPGAKAQSPAPAKRDDTAAEKLGWHLATKAYTFRTITLFETIEISQSLGVKYFEVNPGQVIAKDIPDKVDEKLSPELRAQIKKKFADAGIRPTNFGVAKLGKDEAKDREIFTLMRDLGIQTIVSEPPADAMEVVDKLCKEFQISVAIHNHPQPAVYWSPETVLTAIKGHDKRIGACADVGHWTRSGLDAVDCLHQLAGHIVSLHFKDVNDQKKDVPWGTGKTNVKGMLDELHKQKFQGVFAMEYEGGKGSELIEELRQSIAYFDNEAKRIAAEK